MYNFKKRGLALALTLFVVLTSFNLVVSAEAPAVPTGYYEIPIANSGFEDNGGADPLPGWLNESVYDSNVSNPLDYNYAQITDEMAHTGEDANSTKSLLIYDMSSSLTGGGTTEVATSQIAGATAGTKWTAQLKYYIPNGIVGIDQSGTERGSNSAYAQFRFYHSNGALRSMTGITSVTMGNKGEWTTATLPVTTAPSDTPTYVKLVIFNNNFTSNTAITKVYIDDVHIYKYGTGTAPAATTKVFNKVSLSNSDFEQAVTDVVDNPVPGWKNIATTVNATNYFNVTNTNKFSGNNSLLVYDSSAPITSIGSNLYSALPGNAFKADFKVFLPSNLGADGAASPESMYAKFVFYNAAKTPISTVEYKKMSETGRSFKDRWMTLSLDQPAAPALTAWVQIQFYQVGTQKGAAYIDDINFYSTGTAIQMPEPIVANAWEPIENADFEDVVGEGGIVTGWSPIGTVDPATSYSISKMQSKSGFSSLKLTDNSSDNGIEISTPLIKARVGATYVVNYSTYNEREVGGALMGSRSQLVFYEYDSSGIELRKTTKTAGATVTGTSENAWDDLQIEVQVMPNTRYIRLAPGVSALWTTYASYFDDITLGYIDDDYKYISDVTFTNVDATPFTEFVANKQVRASVDIVNKTGTEFPIFLAAAVYNDTSNQLVSVGISNNSLALATDSTLNATFTAPESLQGKTLKIMVWSDGSAFMNPYYINENFPNLVYTEKLTLGSVLSKSITTIAPTAIQTIYNVSSPFGPQKIFRLDFDPANPNITLGAGFANRSPNLIQKMSTIANNASVSGKRVVAAINGDFYNFTTGVPNGALINNNEILSSSIGRNAVGITNDDKIVIGMPVFTIQAHMPTETVNLNFINKSRNTTFSMGLYTPAFGSSTKTDHTIKQGTEVVLNVISGTVKAGQTIETTVHEVRDGLADTAILPGQLVLSGISDAGRPSLQKLVAGDLVNITIGLNQEWANVKEAVGSGAVLLDKGEIPSDLDTIDTLADDHDPRTAIGLRADGTAIMLVIDGRNASYSNGATYREVAKLLKSWGAVQAVNFDGGGSTTFAARKLGDVGVSVLNNPSDGAERSVANGLMVISNEQ